MWWRKGSIDIKEKPQKLLFPKCLAYHKEIRAFRPQIPNSIIAAIARIAGDFALMIKGLISFLRDKSLSAERARFELAVPCGTQTFQACTFGHSDTSPKSNYKCTIYFWELN